MNKAIFLLVTLLGLGMLNASAQKTEGAVDKAIKDPKRMEKSAKADVITHKKNRTIMDSTQQAAPKSPAATKKKKSKRCSRS